MRITLVTETLDIGGAERMAVSLVNELSASAMRDGYVELYQGRS